MEYLYELIDLLNRYTERNIEIENKIRDLVCYLSEKPVPAGARRPSGFDFGAWSERELYECRQAGAQ